mmetsp:Transcript_16578/g.28101  ORF Transcript_16578/g.28101 Transcript_16578/m.28101 type:complete len:368 (-) Transcript_16578:173-1276(-)
MTPILWLLTLSVACVASCASGDPGELELRSPERCSSHDFEQLDALELVEESEPHLATLHLLQMQKIVQETSTNRSSALVMENATAAENSSGAVSSRSKPLGQYTKLVRAPDMHWAVLSLCFAAFVISGSTALAFWYLCRVRHKEEPSVKFKVATTSFVAVVIAAAFWLAAWYFAGAVLKKWLMDYDTAFLGVDVSVDRMALNPWFGTLLVTDLTVGNPPGYGSAHLASVGRLFVDVDMGGLVKSLGHRLTVDKVHVQNVDVIYERSLSTSNVEDVLKHLGVIQSSTSGAAGSPSGPSWPLDFRIHQVNTSDVWVHAELYPINSGVSLSVPNLGWSNFDEVVMPKSNDEGIIIVMATLLDNAKRVLRL